METTQSLTKLTPPLPLFEPKLRNEIAREQEKQNKHYIVLDDDPTGTQTAYDVPVLTTWEVNEIQKELTSGTRLLFILTNSRSLTAQSAAKLVTEIGKNLKTVSDNLGLDIDVICRGDSTLRGHFPVEEKYLFNAMERSPDISLLIPAFFEAGRYTIDDVHYINEEDKLIPVGKSQFSKDKAFGYVSSNLKEWIVEKSFDEISSSEICSIKKEELENQSTEDLILKLATLDKKKYVIVNADNYRELDFFTLALIKSGLSFSVRSSASFVSSILGKETKPLLENGQLVNKKGKGGLIVVGSYVPKSTSQLAYLLDSESLPSLRIDATRIINSENGDYLGECCRLLKTYMNQDRDLLIYTSRDLKVGKTVSENLGINRRISEFIVKLVQSLETPPRFIVAKGGITSSDIATKSLGIKRAMVLGQILAGVPVWKADEKSKFPGVSYIIFPGNVGSKDSLLKAYQKLKRA